MRSFGVILGLLIAAAPAAAADLDVAAAPPRVVAANPPVVPRLVPPCYEAWWPDLLRCKRRVLVDLDAPSVRGQMQVLRGRAKPYPELFSWSR